MAAGVAGARGSGRPLMRLVTMAGAPILQQLHLEERLLRRTGDNWCIINDGTAPATIVMGVSGRVSELVETEPVLRDQVPVIRRFSGGGTVIVDQGTVFVTFICSKTAIAGLQPFPRDIMSWTGQLYGKVFNGFGEFHLRENDYAFSHRKFGGNAQSITRDRWVHHTSFLWDYDMKNMDYLKIPNRAPDYRLARNHTDFLCRMKEYMPSRSVFTEGIISALRDHFTVQPTELETVISDDTGFKPSTKLLSPQDLEDIISTKESHKVQEVQA
ncbi:lipoate-protein ligase A [Oryza brachyantha]|uniref:BPL/LPL catalytic domain-containing protein n=1 Tax=Oryza brachyantha TaxID=4533 RepID=J3MT93_ORYBR|nr:lipoate-protein ligase A [Oryza brachyantha]